MAFKMNRPVIKGTPSHKASIAKAKEKSIVSQARTKADPSLSFAAEQLGRSRIGKSVDYTIDPGKIEIQSTYEKELKQRRRKPEEIITIDEKPIGTETDGVSVPGKQDPPVVEEQKVKKEKGQSKISKAIQTIKDKIAAKRARNKEKYEAEQAEKARIKAEKARLDAEKQAAKDKAKADRLAEKAQLKADAEYVGEGEVEDPNVQYKDTEAYKADERARIEEERRLSSADDQATFNRELNLSQEQDLQSDLMQSIGEKDTEDVKVRKEGEPIFLEDIQEMNRKAKMSGEIDSRSYTAEEAKRLVFDPNTNEMRLPEEIAADNTVSSTDEVAPTTISLEEPKRRDFKSSSDYMRARMKYLKTIEDQGGTSVMQKRDDKIFANANPGGVLRKNMIESGYIPPNQR